MIALASVQWKLLLSGIERKRRKSKKVSHIRKIINEAATTIIIRGLEKEHLQQPVFSSTAT